MICDGRSQIVFGRVPQRDLLRDLAKDLGIPQAVLGSTAELTRLGVFRTQLQRALRIVDRPIQLGEDTTLRNCIIGRGLSRNELGAIQREPTAQYNRLNPGAIERSRTSQQGISTLKRLTRGTDAAGRPEVFVVLLFSLRLLNQIPGFDVVGTRLSCSQPDLLTQTLPQEP